MRIPSEHRSWNLRWIAVIIIVGIVVTFLYFVQAGHLAKANYEWNVNCLANREPPRAFAIHDIAFVNVNILTMTDARILTNQAVLIRNGRISEIGREHDIHLRKEDRVVNGNGAYLMPGLADMHVHFYGMPSELLLMLANGITTVRVMAGQEKLLKWRDAIENGQFLGPSLYVAGPILRGKSSTSSNLTPDVVLQNTEQTVAEVEHQARLGFDLIKPYTWIPENLYRVLVTASKDLGMYVGGHIPYSVGLEGIIAAGQDEVAHVHEFNKFFFTNFDKDKRFSNWRIDEAKMPSIVASVKSAGLSVTTTLWVNLMLTEANEDFQAYLARPAMRYELAAAVPYMRSAQWEFATWQPTYLRETYLPWLFKLTKAFSDADVMLVLGTDSGYPGLVHGFAVHEELELLTTAGLSAFDALETATRNAARAVAEESEWGSIEIGKRADLLLLEENPLANIANTRKLLGVMKSGQWLDRAELDRLLQLVRDDRRNPPIF